MGRAAGNSPGNESGPGRHHANPASAEHKSEKVMLVGVGCKRVGMRRAGGGGGAEHKSKLAIALPYEHCVSTGTCCMEPIFECSPHTSAISMLLYNVLQQSPATVFGIAISSLNCASIRPFRML